MLAAIPNAPSGLDPYNPATAADAKARQELVLRDMLRDHYISQVEYDKAVFPWAASGRALATGRDDGMTKLIFDKNTHQLLGAAIVGVNAGELIAETVLALEMGADAGDIGLTVHPHPTLSETIFFAAEIAEGTITDLYMPKR